MDTAHDTALCITGMGVVCPIGADCAELRQSLKEGRDGIAPVCRFDTSAFGAHLGGSLPETVWREVLQAHPGLDPIVAIAARAAGEAAAEAGVASCDPKRVGLVLGCSTGGYFTSSRAATAGESPEGRLLELRKNRVQRQAQQLAHHLGIAGPSGIVSTACASSSHAIGYAWHLLRNGYADVVLAGGSGELTLAMFSGFYSIGAMSRAPCAP